MRVPIHTPKHLGRLSRFAVGLTCSSHISSEQVWARFSRRGVNAAEKISEVGFLYEDPGRPAQRHTNHKPAFHVAAPAGFFDNNVQWAGAQASE